MQRVVPKLALLAVLVLPGCSCFRLSGGVALGLGGSARLGVLDVGLVAGGCLEAGNAYGLTGGLLTGELGFPFVGRREYLHSVDEKLGRKRLEGLVGLLGKLGDDEPAFCLNRPTEIAVSVYALFLSFHAGFDPEALVRLVLGLELPPPLLESSGDDFNVFEASHVRSLEEAASPLELDQEIENPNALVLEKRVGRTAIYVSPHLALLDRTRPNDPEFEAVATAEETRCEKAFASALRSGDPELLEAVLARAPLAPSSFELVRRLGDLRTERGELDLAVEAFLLEARLARSDEDRARALSRVEAARKLRDQEALPPVVERDEEAFSVAFLHSDTLEQNSSPPRAIAASHGLALVEVGPAVRSDLREIVAFDEARSERWRAKLPRRLWGNEWRYVFARGRLHAVSRNQVVTLDAETGRYEWLWYRKELHTRSEIPFESGLREDPLLEGPPVRLVGEALEWRTDVWEYTSPEPARLERVDPRTGFPLENKP